jgi:membrane protein implicated in regulation of membrane protease activity
MAAVVWLIVGVLLIAAEALSGEFVLIMLGAAALAAAGSAALSEPIWIDVVVFAVTSLGLITLARPVLKRRLQPAETTLTNVQALLGGHAVVVETVDAHNGQIKLKGEIWSARAFDESEVLEPGSAVTVMDIAGATAVVMGER